MTRSIAGTQWKCTNQNLPQHTMNATVIDGAIDPEWNGENEISLRYQNGHTETMTMRRLQADFKQVIPPRPTNVTYLSGRIDTRNREALR